MVGKLESCHACEPVHACSEADAGSLFAQMEYAGAHPDSPLTLGGMLEGIILGI